jgi:hypothetical protein
MTAHIETTQRQFEHKIRDRLFNPVHRYPATGAFSPSAPSGQAAGGGKAVHTPRSSGRTKSA